MMSVRVGVRLELGRRRGLVIKHGDKQLIIRQNPCPLTSCSRELGTEGTTSSS